MEEIVNNFINGEFLEPSNKDYLDIYEPATGLVYGKVAESSNYDVKLATDAAKNAFHSWSQLSFIERSNYLKKISNEIKHRSKDLAQYESKDTGKPITLAKKLTSQEQLRILNFLQNFKNFNFSSYIENRNFYKFNFREPLGVVACISPWNLPLYLFSWKIAPALIVGNTVVAKPSEITPYTAFKLAQICYDIGLPKGVLNIVNGSGQTAGDLIVKNKNIKAISFTGGTSTGKHIYQNSFDSFKKLSLEMGGKNPAIIFKDCHFKSTIKGVVKSSLLIRSDLSLQFKNLLKNQYLKNLKLNFVMLFQINHWRS